MKLSSNQFNKIVKRFKSTKHSQAFLNYPYQSANYIIATNSHMALFLSREIISDSTVIENHLTAKEEESLLSLESYHMNKNAQTNKLIILDSQTIETVISTIKQHQASIKQSSTSTDLSYDNSSNGLFITSQSFLVEGSEQRNSFNLSEEGRGDSFSILLNTTYLIDALQTQLDTDHYTSLTCYESYLKLTNRYAVVVIMKLRLTNK